MKHCITNKLKIFKYKFDGNIDLSAICSEGFTHISIERFTPTSNNIHASRPHSILLWKDEQMKLAIRTDMNDVDENDIFKGEVGHLVFTDTSDYTPILPLEWSDDPFKKMALPQLFFNCLDFSKLVIFDENCLSESGICFYPPSDQDKQIIIVSSIFPTCIECNMVEDDIGFEPEYELSQYLIYNGGYC